MPEALTTMYQRSRARERNGILRAAWNHAYAEGFTDV